MTDSPAYLSANVERFMGFAERYDAFRPRPPAIICAVLTQLAQVPRPALVVDLGSGTGLSTLLWAGHAGAVIGIEPSDDMRRYAEARANALWQSGDTAAAMTEVEAQLAAALKNPGKFFGRVPQFG